jgi:homoserine kinase
MGMAFKLYNTVKVEACESGLYIENWGEQKIPTGFNNLIYITLVNFYERYGQKPPGVHIMQDDHIPMTRGLGSSAACIAAGLLAANELSGAKLSRDELLQIAAGIEGHPDNVAPAIMGGVIVGAMRGGKLYYNKLNIPQLDELRFCILIPDFHLPTEHARGVLPESYSRADAVYNISRSALLTAALVSSDWSLLRASFEDKIHQPYRSKLIPHMDSIFKDAMAAGALGVYLSGAGPTIVAVTLDELKMNLPGGWTRIYLKPDLNGETVERI